MTGLNLIQHYREKLESDDVNDHYAALAFALQLPGICGRMEFPLTSENIKKGLYVENKGALGGYRPSDKQMFIQWFNTHAQLFATCRSAYMSIGEFARDLYEFRNFIVHNGVVLNHYGRVVLVNSRDCVGMVTGRFLFLTVHEFCDMVFDAAGFLFEQFSWRDPESIVFSSSTGCGMDAQFYKSLNNFTIRKFREFWDAHTQEDHALNMLYDFMFSSGSSLWGKVKDYFSENPGGVYEIDQFDMRCSIVLPDNVVFFEKEYFVFPDCPDEGTYSETVC